MYKEKVERNSIENIQKVKWECGEKKLSENVEGESGVSSGEKTRERKLRESTTESRIKVKREHL